MTAIKELIHILSTLPKEEKDYLVAMAKQDKELFLGALRQVLRLDIATKTGNTKVWRKFKRDQEEALTFFLQELDDEEQLHQVKRQLANM